MRDIIIIGEVFGTSGYNRHVYGLSLGLHQAGCNVTIECSRPAGYELNADPMLVKILNAKVVNPIHIMVSLPPSWPIRYNEGKVNDFYPYIVWEGDRVPAYWEEYINNPRVKAIFVPSTHVRDALLRTFKVEKEIHVIPHGYLPSEFYPEQIQTESKAFLFSCVKGFVYGINDRGGVGYLVKAFKEEFRKDEPVDLIVKLNMQYAPQGFDFNKEMEKLGVKRGEGREIQVVTDTFSTEQLRRLYNVSDVTVYPTRAEAFNLAILEGFACKTPTITTNWSGPLDYCNNENSWFIGGKKELVTHDMLYEGVSWMTPDIGELRKAMRYAFEHREEVQKKGQKALETAQGMTWKHTAEKLLKALQIA